MPIITLEVLSDSSNLEQSLQSNFSDMSSSNPGESVSIAQDAGVHFLTEKNRDEPNTNAELNDNKDQDGKESAKGRNELLEYMIRNDGSVICKLCGEILQSRTHWYRHKYKLHVVHPLNPSPLFQCEQCLVYFKSRKGYIGHIASRHSEVLADSSPILTNTQAEAVTKELNATQQPTPESNEEPDPELAIPKSSVPNYQTTVVKQSPSKSTEVKKPYKFNKGENLKSDWEEKRSREEKLVADIIDRVRRECEAQGTGGAARRGYTRRTTVMNT